MCAVALTPQLVQYIPILKPHKYLFYNIYTLVEFSLMMRLFNTIGATKRSTAKIAWTGFLTVLIALTLKYNPTQDFYSYLVIYDNLVYTLILLSYLYTNVDNDKHSFKGPILWITLGILAYAPITSFSMINWAYTHEDPENPFKITARIINDIANTFLYIAYSIALLNKDHFKA